MWQAQSHFTNSPGDGYSHLRASDDSRGPHKVCPGHAVSVGPGWGLSVGSDVQKAHATAFPAKPISCSWPGKHNHPNSLSA